MDKSDHLLIKFNGTNYTSWGLQFQIYLKGKELWGHIDGTDPKPAEGDKAVSKWDTNDAKIMTWLLGSVDPQYILNLRPYKTAKGMWDYLKQVYQQDNSARRFHLEHELSQFTQGTLSIQEYYSQFIRLWMDYTEIIYSSLPDTSIAVVQTIHSTSQRDQFLMKLRPDFEQIRSNLMSRVPSPSIDSCLGELLREEQRFTTQAALQQALSTGPITTAYVARTHQQNRDMTKVQCYSCQKYGHIATQCNKKYYSYCKRKGHVLPKCRRRAHNSSQKANLATLDVSTSSLSPAATTMMPAPPTSSSSLTPEMVQQMIVNAFSALGLSEVVAALQHTEGNIKRQWLLDAVEISCITKFPSTALQVVGLLSGSCCKYMPLLIIDRVTVLNDLPVTLPSLLSDSSWNSIAKSLVQNSWASTERIYAWAMQLANNDSSLCPESIDSSESCRSGLLASVMLNTCVSLKDYLSFEKQLRLANMVIA